MNRRDSDQGFCRGRSAHRRRPRLGGARHRCAAPGGVFCAALTMPPMSWSRLSSDFYRTSRPTLGIAKPDVGNPNAALSLSADWGLHPALRDSIYPLWGKREIAFVPFAGTSDDLTRSHFETQDTIELGQSVSGSRDYRSGFISRLAAELRAQGRSPLPSSCRLSSAARPRSRIWGSTAWASRASTIARPG